MKTLFLSIVLFNPYTLNAQTVCAYKPLTVVSGTGDPSCKTLDVSIKLGSLTTFGTANYMLGVNSDATDFEYKQYLTGTTGSDFTIANGTGTVTFNLPDAGVSARGVVNTSGTGQTFTGPKTFANDLTVSSANLTVSGSGKKLTVPDGTTSAPSLVFTNISTSGLSYSSSGTGADLVENITGSFSAVDKFNFTSWGQLSLTNKNNFLGQLDINVSHDADTHLTTDNPQDGGINISTFGGSTYKTSTFGGRTSAGTETSPSPTILNQPMAMFIGKGYNSTDGWEHTNRGIFAVYAAETHSTSQYQGTYLALHTTTKSSYDDTHISLLINDKGNAGLTENNFLTSTLALGFGTAKADRFFSIEAGSDSRDAGIFIQSKNATKGINIWLDNSTSTTYLDNIEDNSGAIIIMRLLTAGTPLSAITTTTTGSTFKGWVIASTLDAGIATTSTDGVVGLNSTASTSGIPVQYSPRLRLSGTAWNTTAGATQAVDFISEVRPVSGSSVTSGLFVSSQINAGGFADVLSITNDGRISVKAGTSSGLSAKVGGTIDVNTNTTGNTGGSETTIYSKSISGNTLSANGDRMVCTASGTYANTSSNKRVKVKFGATTIFDSGILNITGAQTWYVETIITRTGASTQKCTVTFISSDAALRASTSYSTAAETLSGSVTFAVTGTGANNNDVVFEMGDIEWKPSN